STSHLLINSHGTYDDVRYFCCFATDFTCDGFRVFRPAHRDLFFSFDQYRNCTFICFLYVAQFHCCLWLISNGIDNYFNILSNQYFIQLELYFWKVWGSRFRRNWLRNSDRDYVLDGMPHICWYCIQSPSFSYVSSLFSVGKTCSHGVVGTT